MLTSADINTQSFPIFVINLQSNVKRRELIERQLKSIGAHYEIVEGIPGDDERVKARYDETRAIREHGEAFRMGEKGCATAHALLYERIVRDQIPFTLILEDDILLPQNLITIIECEIRKKDRKWDWLSLDYRSVGWAFMMQWLVATGITIKKRPSFVFYAFLKTAYMIPLSIFESVRNSVARIVPLYAGAKPFYRPIYNASAYVLSLEGAEKLIPFITPIRFTADELPNVVRLKTRFRLWGYVPLIARQNDAFRSNIVDCDTPEFRARYKGKYYLPND